MPIVSIFNAPSLLLGHSFCNVPLFSSHSVLRLLQTRDWVKFNFPKEVEEQEKIFCHYFIEPCLITDFFCPIFRSENLVQKMHDLLNGRLEMANEISRFDLVSGKGEWDVKMSTAPNLSKIFTNNFT